MGFFKKLFNPIMSNNSVNVKEIYNRGVNALAAGKTTEAINIFKTIEDIHPSAAYNLGLIYLNGDGKIIPDFNLSRYYLTKAKELNHPNAEKSACVIGLNTEKAILKNEYFEKFQYSVSQFVYGNQIGNLAYIIANDIIYNVIETSSQKHYSASRFIDYEVYCIDNFANDEVNYFYQQSSLKHHFIEYQDDWESGEVATISDYLNQQVTPNVMRVASAMGKRYSLPELGVLRLIAVDCVYKHYFK